MTIVNSIGGWANSLLSFNDAGKWRQTAQVDFSTTVGTKTVTIDYSGHFAAGNWFQYHLSVNSETAGTIYIDNVRTVEAVPEPTSMAALGLGVVALARRRRARR